MNNMPMDQSQLLDWINQVSFVAYDTALYLDTHPYDEEALSFYNHYRTLRLKAVKMYEEKYGPLTLDGADTDGHWSWGSMRNPWDIRCIWIFSGNAFREKHFCRPRCARKWSVAGCAMRRPRRESA